MWRNGLSIWIVLLILWISACGGGRYQESTPAVTEITLSCLGYECGRVEHQVIDSATALAVTVTAYQDEQNLADNAATTAITPCVEEQELYSQELEGLPGALIYRAKANIVQLIGGKPLVQSTLEIDDPTFYLIGFSPDGKWLVYRTGSPYEGIPHTLHLLSHTGEVVVTTPTELAPTAAGSYSGSWGSMLWVNDETLLVYILEPDPENPGAPPLVVKALLNAYTGTWQQSYFEGLERKPTGAVVFAPDMTRVLYLSQAEGRWPEIRLEDIVQQEILWSEVDTLETLFSWEKNWTGSATWSPDSAWVAFTAVESWREDGRRSGVGVYLLDREGRNGKMITDFDVRYGHGFTAGALSWSPDGRYLSMSVTIASSDPDDPYGSESRIYLYDLGTDKLIDLCWLRGVDSAHNSTMNALVWSPDSRYLAYAASPSVSKSSTIVLVDIYAGKATRLVEDLVIRFKIGGWSSHFSP
jgi:WD40 repeat protein